MLSGKPSRSLGPGNSSRKKSASPASNDRNPFGTILMKWLSVVGGVVGVGTGPVAGLATPISLFARAVSVDFSSTDELARKLRKSSAMSLAVVYRSDARLDNVLRQIRSASL